MAGEEREEEDEEREREGKFGEGKHEKTILLMDKVQLNGVNHRGN